MKSGSENRKPIRDGYKPNLSIPSKSRILCVTMIFDCDATAASRTRAYLGFLRNGLQKINTSCKVAFLQKKSRKLFISISVITFANGGLLNNIGPFEP